MLWKLHKFTHVTFSQKSHENCFMKVFFIMYRYIPYYFLTSENGNCRIFSVTLDLNLEALSVLICNNLPHSVDATSLCFREKVGTGEFLPEIVKINEFN